MIGFIPVQWFVVDKVRLYLMKITNRWYFLSFPRMIAIPINTYGQSETDGFVDGKLVGPLLGWLEWAKLGVAVGANVGFIKHLVEMRGK